MSVKSAGMVRFLAAATLFMEVTIWSWANVPLTTGMLPRNRKLIGLVEG